ETSLIMFVAPHKLIKTLNDMKEVFGDIKVVLAHELTKIHQTVRKETIANFLETFKKQPPKGEYVLLFRLNT
ncbi:MAG: 16S rRNA (cytidine(1402)-2'-O)-methyltransferase, partial [Candidatus Daviesbacteria bacterium]|nr:16S rRNA (cytidine(1402)-2'-O)-methyltransferase [Candidatus Daviesbacteria bacterium]